MGVVKPLPRPLMPPSARNMAPIGSRMNTIYTLEMCIVVRALFFSYFSLFYERAVKGTVSRKITGVKSGIN